MTRRTKSETETFSALERSVGAAGFHISRHARVIDVVEEFADLGDPGPAGPAMGEWLLPALREVAGPFGKHHPWLKAGDWAFAMRSHFDFVVEEPLRTRHPLRPLFAVEFDGPTHSHALVQANDRRKNRLCAAAGLPLVRVDDSLLRRRDRLSAVEWLGELWVARRRELPELLRRRDADIAAGGLADEPDDIWLPPELDVEFLFSRAHPFPPTLTVCERLERRHGVTLPALCAVPGARGQWRATAVMPPVLDLTTAGFVERWDAWAELEGVGGRRGKVAARAEVAAGYPLDDRPTPGDWHDLFRGRCPFLPAGPWLGATGLLGEAFCWYNLVSAIERWLDVNG